MHLLTTEKEFFEKIRKETEEAEAKKLQAEEALLRTMSPEEREAHIASKLAAQAHSEKKGSMLSSQVRYGWGRWNAFGVEVAYDLRETAEGGGSLSDMNTIP